MSYIPRYFIWFEEKILECDSLKMVNQVIFLDHFLYVRNESRNESFYVGATPWAKNTIIAWSVPDISQVPKEFLLALSLEGIR